MRDYVFRNTRTGQFTTTSNLPTSVIHVIIAKGERSNAIPRNNPNTTRENILERLRLELFIRELGL